jgi:hypothetical protein
MQASHLGMEVCGPEAGRGQIPLNLSHLVRSAYKNFSSSFQDSLILAPIDQGAIVSHFSWITSLLLASSFNDSLSYL